MTRRDDMRELCAEAEQLGFVATPTSSGHLKFRAPDGALVFTATTPGDWRSVRNARAALRRAVRQQPNNNSNA